MGRKDQIRLAERHQHGGPGPWDRHLDVQGLWRKMTVARRTFGWRVTVRVAGSTEPDEADASDVADELRELEEDAPCRRCSEQ